ncbi:MAG: hydroxymethylbilane synthase [Planctomycetes bacterium]|nr:hydroxymethylbilane synthase [Planctomycetota bacterium]
MTTGTQREVVIGTRGSDLAMAQTLAVQQALIRAHPQLRCRIETIHTRGDRDTARSIRAMGGVGVFTRELELALIEGRIDLAVHSLKDMPTQQDDGLCLAAAVPEREDPSDVIVTRDGRAMVLLPQGAKVGTSSLRRRAQLAALRGDLQLTDIRGNVDTRLKKVRDGLYDAVVLARAGLARLGMLSRAMEVLGPDRMLPAPGQGALGLEIRRQDSRLADLLAPLDHRPSRLAVTAEREFLRHVEGGCHAPVAAWGRLTSAETLTLTGLVVRCDGTRIVRRDISGPADQAIDLARQLGDEVLDAGGREILTSLARDGDVGTA